MQSAAIPRQYIQGYTEFYKLRFRVTPDVLIPRPESELLVDEVINRAKNPSPITHNSLTIIDIGTGCGNIAISLAKNLNGHPKGINIIATDISQKALNVAKLNAVFHDVENQIIFIKADLLYYDTLVYHNEITPNVIVANLPYIPSERIPFLDSSVKDFEPIIALDGGEDGFDLYRKLFQQIREKTYVFPEEKGKVLRARDKIFSHHSAKQVLIVCEIDYTHGELAVNEALKYFPDAQVEVKTDLAHKQRILIIQPAVLPK